MNKVITTEFAKLLGLSQSENGSWLGDIRTIAGMVRKSVYRRGAATRQEVWNDWRSGFEALGEDSGNIKKSFLDVGERLASVGDLVPVKIGNEYGWVKPKPKWIAVTEKQGVVLGSISPTVEKEAKYPTRKSYTDVIRRFCLKDVSSEGIFLEAEELSLGNWIGQGDWWQFVEEFEYSPESNSISEFWRIQLERLRESQVRSDPESQFTFVLAGSGSYFGSVRSDEATGRWKYSNESDDGMYVGRRRAFNENDWRFFFCEVADKAIVKVVSLSNRDELIWTQLAKGIANRCEEKWAIKEDVVSFEFPPPKQLERLCDVLGWRVGIWKWQLAEIATSKYLEFWNEA